MIIKVTENENGLRLDKALKNLYPEKSRTYLTKMIDEKNILLNGLETKASVTVKLNDEIEVLDIEEKPLEVKKQDLDLDIIYEDEDVAVVNKPKGMVVHPACGNYDNTLVNGLLYELEDLSSINGVVRPGIVHRIDKDTSGLLMVAKNDEASISLTEQLKNHECKREYRAIVSGVIPVDKGKINAPIGRDKTDRKKMAVDQNGKNAITNFTVLERFKNYTYVSCQLETGRTHQIRVHFQYIGYPLVGDPLYGRRKQNDYSGQYLHAKVLGFTHPRTKKWMEFDSELPEYMDEFMKNLEK